MELTTVDHIAIAVSDLEKSKQWYLSSFEGEIVAENNREVIIQYQNIRVSLVLPSHQQPHIAFRKNDTSSFGELRPQLGDINSTFIADPSGNVVELVKV
jgi:catechol 2,3-dioxygenase-like lactoylglutathione lyase family enzyme